MIYAKLLPEPAWPLPSQWHACGVALWRTGARWLAVATGIAMAAAAAGPVATAVTLAMATAEATAAAPAKPAPLLAGMGPDRGPQASANPRAQRYFHQGMTLTWGFNQAEAARAFEQAAALDPACTLCWWGLAWSLGPNINADMAPGDGARVRAALARAQAAAAHASARDRALVEALAARHPAAGNADAVAEDAYAERMRALAGTYPRDADIATLAAEAMLNLHPYDWWQSDGAPQPWTPAARAALQHAIGLAPDHPGAHHYLVHLIESSPRPADAAASADRLRKLVPGSGHLLHMPAHIDMRTGRYADAVAANERSIAADGLYLAEVDAQGAYRVGYVAHNRHFLWASAAMDGRSAVAIAAARSAWRAACGPGGNDRSTGILQHYYVLPLHALVRFGRWREILEETLPPDVAEPYPMAMWHYARGTAYARTGRLPEAKASLARVEALAADPALAGVKVKNINAAQALVRIAALTLAADIALAQGDAAAAVAALERATAIEDGLSYDEPHLWLAPTRHALGAALLAANRPADAARVYGEDLRHYPENGWSLAGLAEAQRRLGHADEATATARRQRVAWARADVALTGSRL